MSRVTQDESFLPNVRRKQNHNASRRKSETEVTKSKLIIPPHHLEPKSTLNIRQSDVKTGALLIAKNVNFFRRPKEFWFVLNCDHSFFSYYKSRQEYMMGSNACGVIDISKCSVVIDPENRGQFIITETRFKSFKLIASNDNDRNSWVQALQLQRAYWNKSKRSKEKMLLQQQLSLSDTHQPTTNYRQISSDRSPLSPLSIRKSFFKQNSSSIDEPRLEKSSSLNRSSSLRPFTISFKLSPVPRRTFFTRKKSGSVENMQVIKPSDAANSETLSINDSPFISPINILQKDLTRSISFDTVRKPSPLQAVSPLMDSMNAADNDLVQDSQGDVFVKYSGGHFLDEDLSDEDSVCEYGNQPSTLIGAQLIIRNCQRDLREAKREIERLKSREQGYKDLLNHRDQQLLELEEQIEEGVIGKPYHSARPYRRDNNTASARMSRRVEELNHQLIQQKRVEEIMYTEVQNLEKLLFRKDAELQLASDKYEETSRALRLQRERHLNLVGYGMTHILGNRNMIISEHMRDGGQTEIKQYSLEERLHHDVTWLWRYCRSEDKELPDLTVDGGTVEDKYGDTLEPSQEDPASILDSVRFLSEHLTEQSAQLNTFHHIPFKEKKEMKRLVRKGLPDSFRKSVWLYAIRLQVNIIRKGQPRNIYEQLVNESNKNRTSFAKDIDLDLYRTFPANVLFRDNDKSLVPTLRRILLAYSVFDPKIGYCQGMNMLAGIALHVLPEEEAFWCLVTILQKLMVENYYSGSLLGAIADQMVLSDLIKEKLPKLGRHMEKYGIEPHLICLNWFITVFADVMPTHQILKIWDTFLLDGRKTIFRYALAILHLHEDNLMQKDDPILLHNYIRLVCAHWIDFDLLRNIAFTKYKSIPKTSRLDELHRVHLLPLTVEHEKRVSKKRKKVINVPQSHSAFLMPQSASYSPIVQRPSNEFLKLHDERKWECGANLLFVKHGFLLCAGECTNSSIYMCKPIYNTDEYSCNPLDLEIGSTVYCMIEVGPFWILGTSNGWLYGIDKVTQQMLWKSELKETPLCFYAPNSDVSENQNNRLYLGLANGKLHSFTLQGLPITLQDGLMLPELFPADTVVVGLGNEPISCLESPGEEMLCCGVGGRICVFETESTQQLYDMIVSSEKRRSIREMRRSRFGLWVSLKGSCVILLYRIQYDMHTLLHKFDYNPYILPTLDLPKLSSNNSTLPQVGKDNRPTTMLVRGDELWIGTHKGSLLVFNIGKEKKDILTDTQLVELQNSIEKETSVFGLSDEIPLFVMPNSGQRQEVTTVKLLTIQKISEHPVRVLLDCDPTDNLGVLTAAGAIGCNGSVRVWRRETKSDTYSSCFVKFTPSVLPPNSIVDPNFHTPQVDNIIGFGCENSLSFSQNSYAPIGNGEVELTPLSPIHEAQVDEFSFKDIS